jgi:hypothetical protein
MRRNVDLMREMLLALENHPHGHAPSELKIEGFSEEEIGYHAYLIVDAGLADGVEMTNMGSAGPEWLLTVLTSQGHDFLDAAREKRVWEQAKVMAGRAGGYTIQILFQTLVQIVAKRMISA